MNDLRRAAAILIIVASTAPACVTTLYQGEKRTEAESAVVLPSTVALEMIDGKDVRRIREDNARYLLAPGPHALAVRMVSLTASAGSISHVYRSEPFIICLNAKAGVQYVIETRLMLDRSWRPRIVIPHKFTNRSQLSEPVGPLEYRQRQLEAVQVPLPMDCSYDNLFPAESGQIARGETADPPPVAPSPSNHSIMEALSLQKDLPIWRPDALPFIELAASLGLSFGSTAVAEAGTNDKLYSGEGTVGSVGLLATPVWLGGDRLGLGVGANIGFKYASSSSAERDIKTSLLRYPTAGTAHALLRIGTPWYVMGAGGIQKDLDVRMSISSSASERQDTWTSRAGWLGRLGMYYHYADRGAFSFGLGFTRQRYATPGGTIGASSVDLWAGVHVGFPRVVRSRGLTAP